jgi:DNA-binding MarR family transcriptional regulator
VPSAESDANNPAGGAGPEPNRSPLNELLDSVFRLVRTFKCKSAWDVSGLTRTQFATLVTLKEHSPRRITSLAEQSRSDLSVLSRQIATLEGWGMVERTRDPKDGRAFLVSLTGKGRQALSKAWAQQTEELRTDLADFSDADLLHAADILQRITGSWDARAANRAIQDQERNPNEDETQPDEH